MLTPTPTHTTCSNPVAYAHLLTHSPTGRASTVLSYLLANHLPTHSRTHSLTYVLTYLRTHVLTYSRTYVLAYLRTYVLTYLLRASGGGGAPDASRRLDGALESSDVAISASLYANRVSAAGAHDCAGAGGAQDGAPARGVHDGASGVGGLRVDVPTRSGK